MILFWIIIGLFGSSTTAQAALTINPENPTEGDRVIAIASGYLPDSCSYAGNFLQHQDGFSLSINVDILQPDGRCLIAMQPYSHDFVFNDLEAGVYNISFTQRFFWYSGEEPVNVTTTELTFEVGAPGVPVALGSRTWETIKAYYRN